MEEHTFMGRIRRKIDSLAESDPEKKRMLRLASHILDELGEELKLQHRAFDANLRQSGEKI